MFEWLRGVLVDAVRAKRTGRYAAIEPEAADPREK